MLRFMSPYGTVGISPAVLESHLPLMSRNSPWQDEDIRLLLLPFLTLAFSENLKF